MKKVIWLGNSKVITSGFPDAARADIGFQLYLLQTGRRPLVSRPMQSIGKGVFELKEQDQSGCIVSSIRFRSKTRSMFYIRLKSKVLKPHQMT